MNKSQFKKRLEYQLFFPALCEFQSLFNSVTS